MKKITFLLTTCLGFSLGALSALTMGREGEPYYIDGIKWQNVTYDDNVNHLIASLPNEPRSVFGSSTFLYSKHGKSDYEITIYPTSSYNLPQNVDKCVQIFESATSKIYRLTPDQATIQYMFRVEFFDVSQKELQGIAIVMRAKNALYVARIDGSDFSLANVFFDSVDVKK